MKVLLILAGLLALFLGRHAVEGRPARGARRGRIPPARAVRERWMASGCMCFRQVEGPDIVLIHGASGNMRDFTLDLVPRLADRYRVTVVDRPGLGHSDRLDRDGATIFEQADVLVRAVAELGVERPLVLGHSYGGAVALAWATRHPEATAGLILLAAASNPWDTPLSTYYRILSSPLGQALAAPVLTAWVPDHVVTDTIASIFAPQPVPEGYADYIGAGLTLQRRALRENALQRAASSTRSARWCRATQGSTGRSRSCTATRTPSSGSPSIPNRWPARSTAPTLSRCRASAIPPPIMPNLRPSSPPSTAPPRGPDCAEGDKPLMSNPITWRTEAGRA